MAVKPGSGKVVTCDSLKRLDRGVSYRRIPACKLLLFFRRLAQGFKPIIRPAAWHFGLPILSNWLPAMARIQGFQFLLSADWLQGQSCPPTVAKAGSRKGINSRNIGNFVETAADCPDKGNEVRLRSRIWCGLLCFRHPIGSPNCGKVGRNSRQSTVATKPPGAAGPTQTQGARRCSCWGICDYRKNFAFVATAKLPTWQDFRKGWQSPAFLH